MDDPADLRAIGHAHRIITTAQLMLQCAVDTARHNGRTWGDIAMSLGMSRQEAEAAYGPKDVPQEHSSDPS